MTEVLDPRDLPANARAAFLALATKSPSLEEVALTRDTDDRRQATWYTLGEHYKNGDIAPLLDAGFLTISLNHREQSELRFSAAGVEAWYAYSGLERPKPRTWDHLRPETGNLVSTWREYDPEG